MMRITPYFGWVLTVFVLTGIMVGQDASNSTPPKIINIPAPDYSEAAKNAGVSGDVFVVVLINKKGIVTVKDAYGPPAPCSNLDDHFTGEVREAAIAAAKTAIFEPATYKGKPVEKGLIIKYHFDPTEKGQSTIGGESGSSDPSQPRIRPKAINIPKPKYPSSWGHIGGVVVVNIVIGENGSVLYAGAVSGHADLRRAAVEAACKATFTPPTLGGKPIRVVWKIEYNFYYYYEKG